jgi:hypothetical protein
MKKYLSIFFFLSAFTSHAQESFFRGNNNYVGPVIVVPTLSATSAATSITLTTASSGGTISDNGGAPITASGICWSSTSNVPTLSDSKTTDGPLGVGTFSSSLTGLAAGVTYNVRAYATNSKGTGYGPVMVFTTLATPPFQAPAIVQAGLILNLDAANPASYPGTGSTWTNLVTGNAVPSFSISSGTYINSNGGVIRFPSTGGFAESTTGFANLTGFTVEVWVKSAGTRGDYDPAVGSNYVPCFFSEKYVGSINMVLAYNTRGLSTPTPNNSYRYESAIYNNGWNAYQIGTNYSSDLNNWIQILLTYDGSKLTIYRNGVSLGTSAALNIGSLNPTSTGYYIAHRWDMSDGVYGDYSTVNMYNRALSASEVTINFDAVKSRFGF